MSIFEPLELSLNPIRYIRWFLPHESIILEVNAYNIVQIIKWLTRNIDGYYDWSILYDQQRPSKRWIEIRVRTKNAHIFSALILTFSK
jgi:hypothetical protein